MPNDYRNERPTVSSNREFETLFPKSCVSIQCPDDFFRLRIDFHQQRLSRPRVTVSQHAIPVRKDFQRRHPSETDSGKIILVDLPHNLFLRRHLDHAVTIPGRDQRVAAC